LAVAGGQSVLDGFPWLIGDNVVAFTRKPFHVQCGGGEMNLIQQASDQILIGGILFWNCPGTRDLLREIYTGPISSDTDDVMRRLM